MMDQKPFDYMSFVNEVGKDGTNMISAAVFELVIVI
jgi:hypothetical protein